MLTARCEANDISIHYHRTGSGAPLVMLHGLMGSGACWTPIARGLEAEFDVILPDARGHGGSSAPESGYLYPDLASDVLGLMGELKLERPVLLGHSMGGMTAALVASVAPALLSKLVLVDPTFLSPAYQQEVFESGVAEQHREALKCSKEELVAKALARSGGRSRELIEIQAEARLNTSLAAFEVLSPPNPDYQDLVRAIDVPTLLVIGDKPVVTLEMAHDLQNSNPLVSVEQIADAGHGLPFDQPERLADVVREFLLGS